MGKSPPSLFLSRWEYQRTLSCHEQGCVLKVVDHRHDVSPTAFKLFKVEDHNALEAARQEFLTLRRLRHPYLAQVGEFGVLPGAYVLKEAGLPAEDLKLLDPFLQEQEDQAECSLAYITFEHVEALNLREAFVSLFPDADGKENGNLSADSWKTYLEALAKICVGLEYVHSRGMIHYDLKPENLLLSPSSSHHQNNGIPGSFEVKLIDFGLCELETTPIGTRARGTVPFVAPEVIEQAHADRRSDLFSLGASIAWSICGRSPFPGDTPAQWLASAREGRTENLRDQAPGIPEKLAELVHRLMAANPEDRPGSCRELIEVLEEAGDFTLPGNLNFSSPRIPITGWERELNLVRDELEQLHRDDSTTSLALFETNPGQFTGSFLEEVETMVLTERFEYVEGVCHSPRGNSYSPFREIICKLAESFDLGSPTWGALKQTIALFIEEVELTEQEAPAPSSSEEDSERVRLVDSLTAVFLELGRQRPLVICLRDLQRASESSLTLLHSIARNLSILREGDGTGPGENRPAPSKLLLLGTWNNETPEQAEETRETTHDRIEALAEEPYCRRLRLRNLTLERVRDWVAERAPHLQVPAGLLQKLYDRSEGLPRLLDEYLRRIDGRHLKISDEQSLNALPKAETSASLLSGLPMNLEGAILEREDLLLTRDRSLLELLVSAGRISVPAETLRVAETKLRGFSEDAPKDEPVNDDTARLEFEQRLRKLESEGFVALRRGIRGTEVQWSCEPASRLLYKRCGKTSLQQYHEVLYEVLSSEFNLHTVEASVPEHLAYHASRAGFANRFLQQAVAAARRLDRFYDYPGAAELCESILEKLAEPDSSTPEGTARNSGLIWSVNWDLVNLYRKMKLLPQALDKLAVLLSLLRDQHSGMDAGRVYRAMGEIYQERNEGTNAIHFLEKSIRELRTPPTVAEGDRPKADDTTRELCRSLLSLGSFLLERGDLDLAGEKVSECHSEAAGREEMDGLLSEAHLLMAQIHNRKNDLEQGLALSREALECAEQAGSRHRATIAIRAICDTHLARGDHDRAAAAIKRGIALSEDEADKYDLSQSYKSLGNVLYNGGDYHRALESYQKSLLLCRQIGDEEGTGRIYNNLGNVLQFRDQTAEAAEYYKLAVAIFSRLNNQYGMAACMNNLAGILERDGKYDEALDYAYRSLEKRKKFSGKSGVGFSYYRIAMIYQAKGELEKALSYALRSIRIREELDDKVGLAYSNLQLAELRMETENLADIFDYAEQGQRGFEELGNRIGQIMARATTARAFFHVGLLDEAEEGLREVITAATAKELPTVAGDSMIRLGMLLAEKGQLADAERQLVESEKLFRGARYRRKLVEAILQLAALRIEMAELKNAEANLEEAYSQLEDLGSRDLIPLYFLLRSRLDMELPEADLESSHKYLQRGLVESREARLRDLDWRFHLQLGMLEQRRGDYRLARIHFQQARTRLEEHSESLPSAYQENFFALRERQQVIRCCEQPMEAFPEPPGDEEEVPVDEPLEWDQEKAARPVHDPGQHAAMNLELMRLHEIIVARGSGQKLDQILERIMDAVIDLVNAERGFLILQPEDPGQEPNIVARDFDKEEIRDPSHKFSTSIAREVMENGEPLLAGNALSEEPFETLRSVRELRLRSVLCVPLKFHEDVLGVIYLDNRHRRHAFQEAELKTLQTFSDQAVIAITTARIIEAQNNKNDRMRSRIEEQTEELAVARKDIEHRQSLLESRYTMENIVARSEAMQKVLLMVQRLASSTLAVCIQGESGTGKELIARSLHFNSERGKGPFISENCGALTETLLESELFGHIQGAFTGAIRDKIGLLEQANDGTLFLDEIGDMSLGMQQKLLRVLEEGEVRPVGAASNITVTPRIISASNKDLRKLVEDGLFREDLFYRLNTVRIDLPPLRERKEDIPEFVDTFSSEIASQLGIKQPSFTRDATKKILAHDWPGNVRELRHLLERTLLIAENESITAQDLILDRSVKGKHEEKNAMEGLFGVADGKDFRNARNFFERMYIEKALQECAGNVATASRLSGLSRESFYRLMKKHSIERQDG